MRFIQLFSSIKDVLYHNSAMYEELLKLPIDNTLTVRTAYERGYKWVFDIEPEVPQDLLQDFIRMIKEKGYKLGKPRYGRLTEEAKNDRGLYEPLKKLAMSK